MLLQSLKNTIKRCLSPNKISRKKLALADRANGYKQRPSFSDQLPWREYNPRSKVFLLEDGRSVGALFNITTISSEAKPEHYLSQLATQIQNVLGIIPHDKESPWIVQVYCQDEPTLAEDMALIKNYVKPELQDNIFTQRHLKIIDTHLKYVAKQDGIFTDHVVSGYPFRGRKRCIRLALYRKVPEQQTARTKRTAVEEVNNIAFRLQRKLKTAGIVANRCNAREFLEWMTRWFNPKPKQANGDTNVLLANNPYPGDDKLPFGYDFTEQCFYGVPESFEEGWLFDEQPHKVLTVQGLSNLPKIGHISAERDYGRGQCYALMDVMPVGSIFVMTVVIQHPDVTKAHLTRVRKSAIGLDAEVQHTRAAIDSAFDEIAMGNALYPTIINVYVKGENKDDLLQKESEVETLLSNSGLHTISYDHELMPVDAYLRYLPFCYDYKFDQKNTYRSRYLLASNIANLLPVYGRSRGTGHPGLYFLNRGGEGVTYDPYNKKDKQSNSHVILLGSTGTGKSNLMCYSMAHQLAMFNPRIVCIESGGSFDQFADYVKDNGKTVNRVTIKPESPISLNPFADGVRVLEQLDKLSQQQKVKITEQIDEDIKHGDAPLPEEESSGDEERDILGEMLLAAQLMITGGEEKEEVRFMRSDRMVLIDAIVEGAKLAKAEQRQMIADDVLYGLEKFTKTLDGERDQVQIQRCREMANGMRFFCSDPLTASFFNCPGKPWPVTDLTIVNLGLFSGDGYEAQRAMAVIGILNKILAMAEANRHLDRPIILYIDECHILLVYALIGAFLTRLAKMARKLGLWLWLATQNVSDFHKGTRRILSMSEHWIVLSVDDEEVAAIDDFRGLNKEEKQLLVSAQKSPGQYTEGVILGKRNRFLFRNVPPLEYLTLAMTEKDEQALFFRIMKQLKLKPHEKYKAALAYAQQLRDKNFQKQTESLSD